MLAGLQAGMGLEHLEQDVAACVDPPVPRFDSRDAGGSNLLQRDGAVLGERVRQHAWRGEDLQLELRQPGVVGGEGADVTARELECE